MAQLVVELDRLADPSAWPDRCARCGATGTILVPVPVQFSKNQDGWHVPLCDKHLNNWHEVQRKNRIGIIVVVTTFVCVATIAALLQPQFAVRQDVLNRFAAAFVSGFLTVIPLGIVLALWAKTQVRIEQIQGRFATIAGVCKAFQQAATITVAPPPLPVTTEETRFEAKRFVQVRVASPQAVTALFGVSLFGGLLFGLGIALGGLQIHEITKDWPTNGWGFLGLEALCLMAFTLLLLGTRALMWKAAWLVGLGGIGIALLIGLVLSFFGFSTQSQFSVLFTGLPLVYLAVGVQHPLIWNGHLRHPLVAVLGSVLAPLVYTGLVFLLAGTEPGPQYYALFLGPVLMMVIVGYMSSLANTPYCLNCSEWLTSRRLGAVARTRAEMETLLDEGGLVSLAAAKTYHAKASPGDTELSVYSCPSCSGQGTVVLVLFDCKESGKARVPTLVPVGRWQYPGESLIVLETVFPPEADSIAKDG